MENAESWTTLTLSDAPTLEGVLPAAGPTTGGTTVALFGEGFLDSPRLSCAFGQITTSGEFVSSRHVNCKTPSLCEVEYGAQVGDEAKQITLKASNNGIHFSSFGLEFLFMPPAKVLTISPRVVSLEDVAAGRAIASISGKRFAPEFKEPRRSSAASSVKSGVVSNLTCRFDGIGDSTAIVVRPTMITCPLPAVPAPEGVVVVTVSINGKDFPPADQGVTLTLAKAPRIASIFPVMGPSSGGTLLHLFGENVGIVDPLTCNFHFGDGFGNGTSKSVAAEYNGIGLVSCVTPPAPSLRINGTPFDGEAVSAVVSVAISSSSSSASSSSKDPNVLGLAFTYYTTPAVTGIFPPAGTVGTSVDIFGEGFIDTALLTCRFGENMVMPLAFKNPNVITCKAPVQGNDRAIVNVEVSNNVIDWTSNGLTFTHRPRATIDSITPKVGPVYGSTIVRVRGSNFPTRTSEVDSEVYCRFGQKLVPATQVEEDQLFCISPAAEAHGSVDLELTMDGTDLTGSDWRFDYVPEVEVSNAHPLRGPEIGGTEITVTVAAFSGLESVVCQFGSPASRVVGRWLSHTSFLCKTLPQRPVIVQLAVSINGQQFADSGLKFSFQPLATVQSVYPTSGSSFGRTVVTVRGTGFVNTSEVACLVGERFGEATYVDPTVVLCRVPAAVTEDSNSLAAVRIANNGLDFTGGIDVMYEYVPSFDLFQINPTLGSIDGGTTLRIDGRGFRTAKNISCVIDGVAVKATVESPERLTCTSPIAANPGTVNVTLSNNAVDMSPSVVSFRYHLPVEVISVYPTSSPEGGGSRLLLTGSGFVDTAGLACVFSSPQDGFQFESSALFITDSLLSCRSPSGRVGHTELRATNNGVEMSLSLVPFTLTSSSTVTQVWPSFGSIYGGTVVRVQGTAFIDSPSAFCRFGDNVVGMDVARDDTTVVCTSPSREEPGQVTVEVTSNGRDWTASGKLFTYVPPVEITSVAPSVGPLAGGTVVRVSGSGFSVADDGGKLLCRFGRTVVTAAVVMGPTSALCLAPPSTRLGPSPLEISINGVDFTSDGWVFYYGPEIEVTYTWPLAGPESGGTLLTIVGAGFTEAGPFICEFGSLSHVVPASRMDSATLSCLSPPHMPGAVPLRLSMNGQQFVATDFMFEYLMESTVRSIVPSFGPWHGGTLIEVKGEGFVNSSALSCFLARRRVPAIFVDGGHVQCITPTSTIHESGPLEVSSNGVDFTNNGVHFTFVAPIKVRHVWPVIGPIAGGTSVVVRGSGFSGGESIRCIFNGKTTLATVRSDEELYCFTPPDNVEGSVLLELTNNMVDKTTSPRNFTYVRPIELRSVRPSRSGEEGGATAIVTGSNFIASPSLACRFGAQEAFPALWLSSTHISCQIPPSPGVPQEVSLTVSNNGQDFAMAPLGFTYIPLFTVTSNNPTMGPVDGGTKVTISGTELGEAGPWACVFGQNLAVPAIQVANEYLQCRSPPHPAGKTSLRVFRSSSPLASAVSGAVAAAASNSLRDFGLYFEYQGNAYVSSTQPRSGSIKGGTPVTLRGFGFSNTSTLACGFGAQGGRLLTSVAVYVAAGMVVCSSPSYPLVTTGGRHVGPVLVSVYLTLNGVDFTDFGPQYMYYEPLEVVSLFPETGSVKGGTLVTIKGRHFLPFEEISCRFGSFSVSPAEFLSSDLIRCTAPPSQEGPTKVVVTASNNMVEFSETSAMFGYHIPARPARFTPPAGPISGGALLEIEGGAFFSTPRLACRIGGEIVKAKLDSPTRMTCRTPRSLTEKHARVQVTVNGVDWEDVGTPSDRHSFIYYRPPELVKLDPSTGPQFGGTHVSVLGYHLAPVFANSSVLCRFGDRSTALEHVSEALALDSSKTDLVEEVVVCKVPDLGADIFSRVEVALSTDGGAHFPASAVVFTYTQV